MHPDIIASVIDAENIAASGRWKALNEKILSRGGTEAAKHWHFQLFSELCCQTFSEYLSLKNAHGSPTRGDISLIAWRARNLLELRIWAAFFCSREENARRIYEDAGRDGRDLFKAFPKWGEATAQPAKWITDFATADSELVSNASKAGVDNLDGAYKAARDAAKSCGLEAEYAIGFKVLSKFAHPTALRLMLPPGEQMDALRDSFFSQGCALFGLTFTTLEAYICNDAVPW